MSESLLTRQLMKKLRAELPTFVVLKHADGWTSGVPDVSVTGNGRTTWLEVKLVELRGIIETKLQRFQMERLERNGGTAFYVMYYTSPFPRSVAIVEPSKRSSVAPYHGLTPYLSSIAGHDHDLVVTLLKRIHA
jgi:hypothetical protein